MKRTTTQDAWRISAGEFPHEGSPREQLLFCLRYAVLAPSSHNTQPWLFRVREDDLDLRADRARSLPVCDPFDRELVISCGCALFNLRVAIEHFGRECEIETMPDAADPDLLARVRLGRPIEPRRESNFLFSSIPERRTNRRTFEPWPVPDDVLSELRHRAAAEGAWLEALRGPAKEALADLIAQADRIQMGDRRFRSELAAWIVPSHSARCDGMPGYARGTGETVSIVEPLLLRTFDWAKLGRAAKDRQLAAGSPVLAVLGTERDDVESWLAAGTALQHVLLGACVTGMQASFLNQPIEVPGLRPGIQELVSKPGFPQVVLRLGYGTPSPPTPRRALEAFLSNGHSQRQEKHP